MPRTRPESSVTGTAPTARTLATTCLNGVSGRTVTTGVVMTSLTVLLIPIAFQLTGIAVGASRADTAEPFSPNTAR